MPIIIIIIIILTCLQRAHWLKWMEITWEICTFEPNKNSFKETFFPTFPSVSSGANQQSGDVARVSQLRLCTGMCSQCSGHAESSLAKVDGQ